MGDVRLVDVLAAVSVATDIGMGQPQEKAIRSCLIATGLARRLELPETEVRDVYVTTLLRHLGCTATAHEEAYYFGGDDIASRPDGERADFGSMREMMAMMFATGRGTGMRRPVHLARAMSLGQKGSDRILIAICEVASRLAARLRLGAGVETALGQVFERWDGKGTPSKLRGDAIALPARIAEIATQAVIFDHEGGPDAALAMVRARSGSWFDPACAASFELHGAALLAEVAASDPWEAVLAAEPTPHRMVSTAALDDMARAFADMVDLKSPYTLGHSTGVATLAGAAAASLGLDVVLVTRAALLHDLGRVGVSNGIWDKAGALTTSEWESVRTHAYLTERILSRSSALEPLAQIAGMHHERLDGSGYHRACAGASLPAAARVLAAADAFNAMTQVRPHRGALVPEAAAEELARAASAGLFDPDVTRAVCEAAGQAGTRVRAERPAGLSEREVEVLRLVARGLSNKQVAKELFISARTAEHHVQAIYGKIGSSTRASAAMFAMEQGLVVD